MDRLALGSLLQRNEFAALTAYMFGVPSCAESFKFGVARRAGLLLLSSKDSSTPLFHRAIGLGVLTPATPRAIDSVIRYYSALDTDARVEFADGLAPEETRRLLEHAGFRREGEHHTVHVLEATAPPAVRSVRGLSIETLTADRFDEFGRLARAGFEESGLPGEFVEESTAAVLRNSRAARFVGIIGKINGVDASTGVICLTRGVGGLYSDSTLPEFRGRGIQRALIAERVAMGLRRRRTIFTARTEGTNTSGRNYAGTGFHPLYRATFYRRPA